MTEHLSSANIKILGRQMWGLRIFWSDPVKEKINLVKEGNFFNEFRGNVLDFRGVRHGKNFRRHLLLSSLSDGDVFDLLRGERMETSVEDVCAILGSSGRHALSKEDANIFYIKLDGSLKPFCVFHCNGFWFARIYLFGSEGDLWSNGTVVFTQGL